MAERTCIACRRIASRSELVRFTQCDGRVSLDSNGSAPGRGAWLCPSLDCFDRAVRQGAFGRALRSGRSGKDLLSGERATALRRQFEVFTRNRR